MNSIDELTRAGDVKITRIEIVNNSGVSVNVTRQVASIEVYEDLFAPFITGNITLVDAHDIASLFPLIGEERINIEIQTPGQNESYQKFSEQFYIYKMSDRDHATEKTLVYRLHFISLEGITDANKRLSRSFSGKVSDITKSLFGPDGLGTKKPLMIEDTSNSVKYVSNYWSPAQNISYMMETAKNNRGTASYVFFENREGFVFSSLGALYAVPPMQKFIKDNYVRDVDSSGETARNIPRDYQRIQSIFIPESFDYIDRVQSGFYASSMTTFDTTTKKYSFKNYYAANDLGIDRKLNDSPLITSNSVYRAQALHLVFPKQFGNFNGFGDVTNTETVQKRISSLKQAQALKVQITVPGMTSYTVGRVVELEIYKSAPTDKSDTPESVLDTLHSGLFLISSICHNFDKDNHTCTMELIKDSILSKEK